MATEIEKGFIEVEKDYPPFALRWDFEYSRLVIEVQRKRFLDDSSASKFRDIVYEMVRVQGLLNPDKLSLESLKNFGSLMAKHYCMLVDKGSIKVLPGPLLWVDPRYRFEPVAVEVVT